MAGILNISDSRSSLTDEFDISQINFSDTRDRSGLVLGSAATMLVLVSLVVSVRIYARVGITGRLFADDGLSTLFSFLVSSAVGYGREDWKSGRRERAGINKARMKRI